MRALWIGVGLALLSGCSSGPSRGELASRVDELEGSVSDLTEQLATAQETIEEREAQLEEARGKVSALAEASGDLQDQVARFDGENWRDVVDDARTAASDVEDATSEAQSAVEEQ